MKVVKLSLVGLLFILLSANSVFADDVLGMWQIKYFDKNTVDDSGFTTMSLTGNRLEIVTKCLISGTETDEDTGETWEWTNEWYVGTLDGVTFSDIYLYPEGNRISFSLDYETPSGKEWNRLDHDFQVTEEGIVGLVDGDIYTLSNDWTELNSGPTTSFNGKTSIEKIAGPRRSLSSNEIEATCDYGRFEEGDGKG